MTDAPAEVRTRHPGSSTPGSVRAKDATTSPEAMAELGYQK